MVRKILLHKTSQKGYREDNEDVEAYLLNLGVDYNNSPYLPIDFFVVCDGHGGSAVAKYVAPRLQELLTRNRANFSYPIAHSNIVKIFNQIQSELISHSKRIAADCGCTCLAMVRYLDHGSEYVQLMNIGDCRAVLSRQGVAIALTKDHKPYWPDEKARISKVSKELGTNVKPERDVYGEWRIGDLSVSRAFGDLDNTPYVSHVPDSMIYHLENKDEFIILACDGLWDVIENHDAVNFVRDHYYGGNTECYNVYMIDKMTGQPKIDPRTKEKILLFPNSKDKKVQNIANKLAMYAIAKGSGDNVSVMIVFLNSPR